ncbi:ThuA domain-containing protein [Haloferula sp.]|uniref:ThuA domain-containing protein n=1 Tax=Haloferula sp. TaxID=2497595 RepID=UPI00329D681B
MACFALATIPYSSYAAEPKVLRILNFQADNGFQHKSKPEAMALVERLGEENGWKVVSTRNSSSLTELDLSTFDTVVFNNNCGNKGRIMKPAEQLAFQKYIQNGGGFLGVHCAGAIWKEGGEFQPWYEGLVGTKLVDHPKVQEARLIVEDRSHPATSHLPEEWVVTDEWHRFGSNPRENVKVLISVDEDSYQGKQKMGGDHPFVWHHEYDGGRSFFTSLGHTKEIYSNPKFEKLIEGAIRWTSAGNGTESSEPIADTKVTPPNPGTTNLPVNKGLFLDLDANLEVEVEDGDRVKAWHNQVSGNAADVFVKQDEGRKRAGSGRPTLKKSVSEIGGNSTLIFEEQELINMDEDAFDHMVTGSGYTWFSVMSVYKQRVGKKDVNSFFGNLKNGPHYEGFWGNLMDDNRVWMGTRNGKPAKGKPTLWHKELNPCVVTPEPLTEHRYYLVMGRMGAGQELVDLELFINSTTPVDSKPVPVNPKANPSKMAVGQERDAVNHPGKESFHGEISRLLIYERPLSDDELEQMTRHLSDSYQIQQNP